MKKSIDPTALLHDHDLKSTPIRMAILEVLAASSSPLSVEQIIKKLRKKGGDTATLYRALHAFTKAGITSELSLSPTLSHYTLLSQESHDHHAICERCGTIESIDFCVRTLDSGASKKSKLFKHIKRHTISFFGTCKKCVRAVR